MYLCYKAVQSRRTCSVMLPLHVHWLCYHTNRVATGNTTVSRDYQPAATQHVLPLLEGAVIVLWLLTPPSHNLTHALQLSSIFLQAQRCTPEALTNQTIAAVLPSGIASLNNTATGITAEPWMDQALHFYPWLGAAATGDPADTVQGGYYMGADYVKHSLPLATSMSMLAWSLMAFKPGFDKVSCVPSPYNRYASPEGGIPLLRNALKQRCTANDCV